LLALAGLLLLAGTGVVGAQERADRRGDVTGDIPSVASGPPDCSAVSYPGNGTSANPHEVSTLAQLQCLDLDASYEQVADIDAGATATWHNGSGFEPVGNESQPFTGSFDGAGHAIVNLTVDRPAKRTTGLFGATGNGSSVSNVSLDSATVTGAESVGALVGLNDGAVTGSNATARVTGPGSDRCRAVPQVAFDYEYNSVLNQVVVRFAGGESLDSDRVRFAGDVAQAGQTWTAVDPSLLGSGTITAGQSVTLDIASMPDAYELELRWTPPSGNDSVVIARDTGPDGPDSETPCNANSTSVGGLVGENHGTVNHSSATGAVTGREAAGGLVGTNEGAVSRSSAHGPINAFALPVCSAPRADFAYTYDDTTGEITVRLASGDGFDSDRVSFVGDVNEDGETWTDVRPGGRTEVTVGDTVVLTTPLDDYALSIVWTSESGNTSLALGSTTGPDRDSDAAAIGDAYSKLCATPVQAQGGLVGHSSGLVTHSSASGDVSGKDEVGGLVGESTGTIRQSTATGAVDGSSSVGGLAGAAEAVRQSNASGQVNGSFNVGGLVGLADGAVTGSSASGRVEGINNDVGGLVGNAESVNRSSASGHVVGSFEVGGLVGRAESVNQSSATGNVSGAETVGGLAGAAETVAASNATGGVEGTSKVGGLVGTSTGTVRRSSATGPVAGSTSVGGLVGRLGTQVEPGRVAASYATGRVTGAGSIGGLIGTNNGIASRTYAAGAVTVTGGGRVGGLVGVGNGTVTGSYADLNATGQSVSAGGTGLTTAEMTGSAAETNLSAFDFATTWQSVPGEYPALRSKSGPVAPLVDGQRASDPDGDGRYEDVDGKRGFTILDVQALFNNLDNPAVVNNAAAFNFQTSFDTVSTLDVQALFNELPN
jgi:hypothetical protein